MRHRDDGAFTREEGQVAIFLAVDHCSMESVEIHAAKSGTRFEALEPIRHSVREHLGALGKDTAVGLALRHDRGSQHMSDVFQSESKFLGIESSTAFVREPEGNGCAGCFVRILKENLLWVRTFETVEELRTTSSSSGGSTTRPGFLKGMATRLRLRSGVSSAAALPGLLVETDECPSTLDRYKRNRARSSASQIPDDVK
jgi:hypothetical protein